MRAIWASAGIAFWVIVAVLITVGWVRWYQDCPQDLTVTDISAGPVSNYEDVAWLAGELKARSKPEISVARISFTSSADLRHIEEAERWTGSKFVFASCGCDEAQQQKLHQTCERPIIGVYDPAGWINSYNHYLVSSRPTPDDKIVHYRMYIELASWGSERDSYDLTKKPTDLCVQFVRRLLFLPSHRSNVLRITKQQLTKELSIGRIASERRKAAEEETQRRFDAKWKSMRIVPPPYDYTQLPKLENPLAPKPDRRDFYPLTNPLSKESHDH